MEPGATSSTLCVLAADVQGFGNFMRAGADAPVRRALEDAVRLSAKDAICVETGGDAVLIVHDDPITAFEFVVPWSIARITWSLGDRLTDIFLSPEFSFENRDDGG